MIAAPTAGLFLSRRWAIAALLASLFLPLTAGAGPLRDWLASRETSESLIDPADDDTRPPFTLPSGVRLLHDQAYGPHARQRMDVYFPQQATTAPAAPVILMVHGGAWRLGDKAMRRVVENKVTHWLPKGFIFVSVNYRLLPDTPPLEQARDVALALATVQARTGRWGGDPSRVILMGHSAGAHLVALLNANPALALVQGARPWRGTVALDSAAMNLRQLMEGHHPRLYDRAFGQSAADWTAASPTLQQTTEAPPLLAVCSSQRKDACPQAEGLRQRAATLGTRVEVLPQDLSHSEINRRLGLPGDYTAAVDSFLSSVLAAP